MAGPSASPSSRKPPPNSAIAWLASRPAGERKRILAGLSEAHQAALLYDWPSWARPEQTAPPGDWLTWLIKAGRGFGKTRAAAEWVRAKVERGEARRVALVNDTSADARGVMVEGMAGLLRICPPWNRPKYEPTKRQLTWPNGAVAVCYAAEAPEMLRGPEHDLAWADEPAKWRNLRKKDPQGGTAWDNLLMGLRIGRHPQCVVSTTPRPVPFLKVLLKQSTTVVTGGSTYDNLPNLAPSFAGQILEKYEGTRLGRQEIHAEMIDDMPGALWSRERLERNRVQAAPALVRIVVAVDPAASTEEGASETGIVVGGLGEDGHGYVLADLSGRYTPGQWGAEAVRQYALLEADRIVGEVNNGGEMVGHTVRMAARDAGTEVSYKAVTASRGKLTRAEPVAALDEQGRVHVVGCLPDLEDQLCSWVPGMASPDRLDAMVWALTELMLGAAGPLRFLGEQPPADEAEREKREKEEREEQVKAARESLEEIVRNQGAYWPGRR